MARGFTTMQSRVGAFVLDTSAAFATIIGYFINDRYRDISKRTAWSVLIKDDYTFDTVANQVLYDLETDFDEALFMANIEDGEEIVQSNEGNWWKENAGAYQGDSIASESTPTRYVILREQGKLKLDPSPSAIKTIAFPYKILVTDLSSTTAPSIHDIESIIEYGAISDAFAYKRQLAKADYYNQKFEYELSKRIAREKAPYNMLHQFIPASNKTSMPKRLLGDDSYV
jgi:hypothetical protein